MMKYHWPLTVISVCLWLASLACGAGGAPSPAPTLPAQTNTAQLADDTIATLEPPLADVPIPDDPLPYPDDWPAEFQFPDSLVLVESTSGSLPDTATAGWGAKFRYAGDPAGAATVMGAYLESQAWQTVEREALDSGGVLLVVENAAGGSGIVVIDPDPAQVGHCVIVATFLP